MDVDLSDDDGLAVHDGEQHNHGDEAESAEQLLPAASDKETSSSVSEADQALHAKYAGVSCGIRQVVVPMSGNRPYASLVMN